MPIFERQSQSGELLISFEATDLVMAGWTGRDAGCRSAPYRRTRSAGREAAVQDAALFYRVDPALLDRGRRRDRRGGRKRVPAKLKR